MIETSLLECCRPPLRLPLDLRRDLRCIFELCASKKIRTNTIFLHLPRSNDGEQAAKVVHLSELEHFLQRPDMYIGALEPREHSLLSFETTPPSYVTITESPALIALANELSTNALDNARRDATQRYIEVAWNADDDHFTVSNDGSCLSVERDAEGQWPVVLAFRDLRSGTSFNVEETGKKDTMYTAGRNGVGARGVREWAA